MRLTFKEDDLHRYLYMDSNGEADPHKLDLVELRRTTKNYGIKCDQIFELIFSGHSQIKDPDIYEKFIEAFHIIFRNGVHTVIVRKETLEDYYTENYIIPLEDMYKDRFRFEEFSEYYVIYGNPEKIQIDKICKLCGGSRVLFGEERGGDYIN